MIIHYCKSPVVSCLAMALGSKAAIVFLSLCVCKANRAALILWIGGTRPIAQLTVQEINR